MRARERSKSSETSQRNSLMRTSLLARLVLSLAAACLPLSGCNRIETKPRPLPTGPSVVLVTIDTLRSDYVGAHQAGRDTETPVLDALAAEGVRFANAIATAPLTLPSHTSIMTGLYPPHHGVRGDARFHAAPELETVAERFQAAGYATGAVVGAALLDAQSGLAQGFDEYDAPMRGSAAAPGGREERKAADVTDRALAFFASADRPFFLWVHYYDPHGDYAPPAPYRERFAKDPYAGEVAYVDAELGRLMAALRERGQLERTVVCVTADHGEGLGEHGELGHGSLVFESTLHVPWIVRGPGIPAGRIVDTVTSNAAVAQTLAHVAVVGALAQADVESAAPLWGDAAQPSQGWAYAESLAGEAPLYALRRGSEKFIESTRAELYELASDPRERTNLLETKSASSEPAARAAQLVAFVRSGERVVGPAEPLAGGRAVPPPAAAAPR
jgi:arylsulfatase A-like enzyme